MDDSSKQSELHATIKGLSAQVQRSRKDDIKDKDVDVIVKDDCDFGVDDDDVFVDYRYGWCGWHPSWIQGLNRPVWLLVFLSLYIGLQGAVLNGFVSVIISTLERRFDLSSTKSGLIPSTYDIATGSIVVFVSYYCGRRNKARWIAFGCVIFSIGCVTFALPHFLSGLHTTLSGGNLICVEDSEDGCERTPESANVSRYFYVFFIVAQILNGIGCTPLTTLAIPLLDEGVSVHQSSLYIGIHFAAAALGPAIGYIGGGAILNIYTDVGRVNISSLDITPEDPGWVGAWWLGFFIYGGLLLFVAIPISGFPKELPSTPEVRAAKVSQAHTSFSDDKVAHPNFSEKLGDFPRAVKYLLRNPTFVCLCLTSGVESALVAGMGSFGPKFIETQFGKTAGEASLLMGACTIPGAVLGTFIGGYLSKRCKLKVRGMLKLCCGSIIIALICISCMLLRCEQEYVVGVNVDYHGNRTFSDSDKVLANDCNANCDCSKTEFNPVCDDNGMEYFDPCFAGCTQMSDDTKTFSDCSCLELTDMNSTLTASYGKCPKDCGYLLLFLVLFTLAMVFHFICATPGASCLLRCVPESQRSLALGVSYLFFRFLGSVPGPVIYGAALDTSCLLWQESCDGDQGSCFLYDAKTVSMKMFLLSFGLQFLALVFFLMALYSYRSPEDDEKDKDEARTDQKNAELQNGRQFQNEKRLNRMISQSSQMGTIANDNLVN